VTIGDRKSRNQTRSQAWANPDTAQAARETARAAQLAFKK